MASVPDPTSELNLSTARADERDCQEARRRSAGSAASNKEEIRALLKDLPLAPAYDASDQELNHIPEGNKDSGWQNCLKSVGRYDQDMCQAYREQIDTLLVFAGLFSAVVTAFAVESYQWLQEDPLDTSVELLRDIVGLLAQNTTAPLQLKPSPLPRLSDAVVTRVNVFWFSSLSLSLSAALVGILCKQWLREYERDVGQSPEVALAVRHIRFLGLEYWKVGTIVNSVPIMLQVALAFFLTGIADLLWRLHSAVAACVTVVSGITLVLYLATTLLPLMQYACICMRCCLGPELTRNYPRLKAFTEPQCAFKSAQAWIALGLFQPVIDYLLKARATCFTGGEPPGHHALELRRATSWATFDVNWVKRLGHIHAGPQPAFESLAWIASHLGEAHSSSWVWHCVWSRWVRSRDNLGALVDASVDIGAVAQSYPNIVTLSWRNSPNVVSQARVFQCSLRTDLPVDTAVELILRVAPTVGLHSQWTRDALRSVLVVYRDLAFQLSDDLAAGLFRLAEELTRIIIDGQDGPNSATPYNAAIAFRSIFLIICRGSRFHVQLLSAMCGLAESWLRARPPRQVAAVARSILEDMITYLIPVRYDVERLQQHPGIIFPARLAREIRMQWPILGFTFDRKIYPHYHQFILGQILAIGFAERPYVAPTELDNETAPQGEPVGGPGQSPCVPGANKVQTGEAVDGEVGVGDTGPGAVTLRDEKREVSPSSVQGSRVELNGDAL